MPSARLDSRRNSVQNGVADSFPTVTGTIFVNVFDFYIFRTISGPKNSNRQNDPSGRPKTGEKIYVKIRRKT